MRRSGAASWRSVAVTAMVTVAVGVGGSGTASASVPDTTRLGDVTGTGIHNTYDKGKFSTLTAALDTLTSTGDTGPKLLELDVWTLWSRWLVSHDLPVLPIDNNNCTSGSTRNQDLGVCLSNLASWHAAHPNHAPIIVKIEMKNGFAASSGFGPAQFDALLTAKLGTAALYRPVDLLTQAGGSRYANLAAAAAADNWATLTAARGRFMVLVQTGTFEAANPLDTLHTDVEYGTYLASHVDAATAFPVVLRNGATGDPRAAYAASLQPWFVSIDTDAVGFAALPAATRAWYAAGHLWVVATDVDQVPPALSATSPTSAQAVARVALMACDQASIASSDWAAVPAWYVAFARGSC